MMWKFIAILLLYIVFSSILGILAFALKRRYTKFPDFRVGYHDKRIMESKEKWDYANHMAGNLCAFFAVISIIVFALLYFIKADPDITIIIFFVLSTIAILSILFFPIQLSKKFDKL